MTILKRSLLVLAATLATSTLMVGCVVVPGGHPYGGGGQGGPVMVLPPGPQVELIGVAPGPGFFWIGGFWNWAGGRHVWNGGHWEQNRQGQRWAPHQWHRDGSGWREAPGRWEQR